ncbi:MAG TPA: methylmalonyl Co-A mutase-associated GTPase MeaB [Chitinophagaceae bacterium]|nr:methylmalonyl Co-A mutase-associated GTPase MeaB [Chitinophagaceae bacterium]
MWQPLLQQIIDGDKKALARGISLVENEVEGYEELLQQLPLTNATIIGITGPPGAGKSTLTDALIGELMHEEKKIGVLCVDPSSPFNYGSLLGDRIRMSEWYNNPNVFIRSLATRGSLGGLHPKIIEITDVMKAACFDYIIIETVGVGQSEVEIAGLADITVVVLVPESGDVIQTMKAGLMEIADIFVVNKSDRPDAETFVNNLKMMLAPAFNNKKKIPIVKTVASDKKGISDLKEEILNYKEKKTGENKFTMLAEKAWQLIQNKKMNTVSKTKLKEDIQEKTKAGIGFNLYKYIQQYY